MVALLAAGCSKREEREPAPVSAPKAGAAGAPVVEDVDALRAAMEDREAAGDDVGAASAGDKLVAQMRARKLTGDPAYASALDIYSRVLFSTGRWPDAEAVLKEGLELPQGKSDPVLRSAMLFQLGAVYSEQRRNEEAIPVLLESLELSEKAHGPDSYATSNTVEVLAAVYDYAGRYTEAEALFRRSLKIAEKTHGATSQQVGRVITNLALNMIFQERIDDALVLYKRALPMLETSRGYDRSALAEVHGGIAQIHRKRDKLALAEASYRRALAVRTEALGADHPLTAMDNYNLSIVLEDQNKLGPAIEACTKSESLRATTLAADHPHRVETEEACERMRTAAARPLRKQRK